MCGVRDSYDHMIVASMTHPSESIIQQPLLIYSISSNNKSSIIATPLLNNLVVINPSLQHTLPHWLTPLGAQLPQE